MINFVEFCAIGLVHKRMGFLKSLKEFEDTSIADLRKLSFGIRRAVRGDLESVLRIENKCWTSKMRRSRSLLLNYINGGTSGQIYVATDLNEKETFASIILRFNERNDMELLAVSSLPERRDHQAGNILRLFALQLARFDSRAESVIAMSRTSSFKGSDMVRYREYVRSGVDPTMRFHISHGAQLIEILENARPEDEQNLGCIVKLKYDVTSSSLPSSFSSTGTSLDISQLETIMRQVGLKEFRYARDLDTPFMNLGVDSIQMVEIATSIEKLTSTPLGSLSLFNFPTARELLNRHSTVRVTTSSSSSKTSSCENDDPIVIVRMTCRLPGGIRTPEQFYDALCKKTNTVRSAPWKKRNAQQQQYGAFLNDEDAFEFSPKTFGLSEAEVEMMDPHQRLLLTVVYEALKKKRDLGPEVSDLSGSDTGVYIGHCNNEWSRSQSVKTTNAYTGTGSSHSILANRISFLLGLTGPSMTIDTACSSSLVALHVAKNALLNGECSAAIVASADLMLSPFSLDVREKAGMLSSNGTCRPFDAQANGYVRGEGAVCVVLKRLSGVRKDETIHTILRGSAVNQDGRSARLTAPCGVAQQEVIKRALVDANLEARDVQYVEAHGTGTRLGDPIELNSLRAVYGNAKRESQLLIGAVKSNIGHLEGAAGLAGLLKTILVLEHACVPANLNLERINPLYEEKSNGNGSLVRALKTISLFPLTTSEKREHITGTIGFPTETTKLCDKNRMIIGAVSSFGFGGTNAHVVVQRPATRESHPVSSPVRCTKQKRVVAFVFTGQGSQQIEMGATLFEKEAIFRDIMTWCSEELKDVLKHRLLDILYPKNESQRQISEARIQETEYAQPAVFALGYALAMLWKSRGVEPDVVVGHSLGEYISACVAGVMSPSSAIRLVARRAQAMQRVPKCDGVMIAIRGMSEKKIRDAVMKEAECSVAAVNGPQDVVLSGNRETVSKVLTRLGDSVKSRALNVSHAFHSPLMKPAFDEMLPYFDKMSFQDPKIPIVTTLHGHLATAAHLKSSSHWAHHMLQPVRFYDSIRTLRRMRCDTFVEIGSGSTMLRLVRKCIDDEENDVMYVSSIDDETGHIDRALMELRREPTETVSKVSYYTWRSKKDAVVEDVKDERTASLEQFILESIARILPGNVVLSLDDSLVRSGLDSLSAIELCSRITSKFASVELSSSQILRTRSVRHLIDTIRSRLDSSSSTPTTPRVLPSSTEKSFSMSSLQQGMVFQRRMSSDSEEMFLESMVWTADDEIDSKRLSEAWARVVRRIPSLRTEFDEITLTQRVMSEITATEIVTTEENDVNEFVQRDRKQGLSLSHAPLARLSILKDRRRVVLLIHHLICDAWSIRLIMQILSEEYANNSECGEVSSSLVLPRFQIHSKVEDKDVHFWSDRLSSFRTRSKIARRDEPKLDLRSSEIIRETRVESVEFVNSMRRFASSIDVTLASLIHTAFYVTYSDLCEREDVVYGYTMSGRSHGKLDCVVGPVLNTAPMCLRFPSTTPFEDAARAVHESMQAQIEHETLPLIEIQRLSKIKEAPLFNVILDFQPSAWDFCLKDTKFVQTKLLELIGTPLWFRFVVQSDGSLGLCGQSETSAFDRRFVLSVMDRTVDVMRRVLRNKKRRALLLNDIIINREKETSRIELPTSSLILSNENVAISSRVDATTFFESCKACDLDIKKALMAILALSLEKYRHVSSVAVNISTEKNRSFMISLKEKIRFVDCVREIRETKTDDACIIMFFDSLEESLETEKNCDLACHVNLSSNNIITFQTRSKVQVPGAVTRNISQRMIFYIRVLCSNIDIELRDLMMHSKSPQAVPIAPCTAKLSSSLLYDSISAHTDRVAIVQENRRLDYNMLDRYSYDVARCVSKSMSGQRVVAVVARKGWQQIVGAVGILKAGCAYLPLDPDQLPRARIEEIFRLSHTCGVVSESETLKSYPWLKPHCLVNVDKCSSDCSACERVVVSERDMAYLIYTSGSTGVPKGVCCHHQGAMNTIEDLNERFQVGPQDRVLALSSLSFDLSVYDMFGMFAAGATMVIPPSSSMRPPNPETWLRLMIEHKITMWNTVPALMELLVCYAEHSKRRLPRSLRLVWMSGDFIALGLSKRIRDLSENENLQIISMGGATEAAIWSNMYEIPRVLSPDWSSIPYGRPLRNQTMYILNSKMQHCEHWVTGSIYIGGAGVALGYYGDAIRTAAQFVTHPLTKERLFRTGDLGRLRPDGNIEILGREDSQVKVNGFRVELGEIEHVLSEHSEVNSVSVALIERRLVAYIVASSEKKMDFESLRRLCSDRLADYMIPRHFMLVDSLPLSSNGKVRRDLLPRPEFSNTSPSSRIKQTPSNDIQRQIRDEMASLLDLSPKQICCVRDDFFTLGGDSMSALRLLLRLQTLFSVRIGVRELFEDASVKGIEDQLFTATTSSTQLELIPLRKGSPERDPLILIHAAGASCMSYMGVLSEIKDLDLPIYAVNDTFLSKEDVSFSYKSIEAVAKDVADMIVKRLGARRSLTLGGWSYGGVVSVSVASILETRNKIQVKSVVMLDSPIGQARYQNKLKRSGLDPFSHESDAVKALNRNGSDDRQVSHRAFEHFKHCTALLNTFDESTQPKLRCREIVDVRPKIGSDCNFLDTDTMRLLMESGGRVVRYLAPSGTHWTMLDKSVGYLGHVLSKHSC